MRRSTIVALLFFLGFSGTLPEPTAAQEAPPLTRADIDAWMVELSNWGRWGPDDQLGTLNFITPEKRRSALALAEDGEVVSLARDLDKAEGPDNSDPLEHEVSGGRTFAMDRFSISYHGYAHSHIDALAHMAYEGRMYNGVPVDEVRPDGASRLGIEQMAEGIVTRGILVDVPLLRGVDYLEPGEPILVEDLEAWEARTGLRIGTGDVVFVRTGRWLRRETLGPWPSTSFAGLHASVAPWLHEREVAALGGDQAQDVMPSQVEGVYLPLHQLTLVAMGMPLFDNQQLEELARVAAEREQWEFLLVASPLRIPGGIGSPANPLAIF